MNWKAVAGIAFCKDLSYTNAKNNLHEEGSLKPSTSTFLGGQEGTASPNHNLIDPARTLGIGSENVGSASLVDGSKDRGILARFMGDTFIAVPTFLGGSSDPVTAPAILSSPKVDIWTSELEYSGLDIT